MWVSLALGLTAVGSSSLLIRYAGDAPAMAIAAWRTSFVAVLLVPAAVMRCREEYKRLPFRDYLLVGVSGVLLGLHFLAWIGSVQLTSVASAAVLVSTAPLFIVVLSVVFLKEIPSTGVVVAIALAIAGAILIGLSDASGGGRTFPNEALGNAMAVVAAVLVSVYFLIGRSVRPRVSFLAFFAPLNAVAALTALLACAVAGVDLVLPLPVLGLCLLMALGPGLLGHGSFSYSLRYISASTLGLLTLTEPVIASVGALALFDERPTSLGFAGMLMVLLAIAAVLARDSKRPKGKVLDAQVGEVPSST